MSSAPQKGLFREVDRSGDPEFFIRFMDEAQRPAGIQAAKQIMREKLALRTGAAVLDVGCGPGDDVVQRARLVGSTGRVVGSTPA